MYHARLKNVDRQLYIQVIINATSKISYYNTSN